MDIVWAKSTPWDDAAWLLVCSGKVEKWHLWPQTYCMIEILAYHLFLLTFIGKNLIVNQGHGCGTSLTSSCCWPCLHDQMNAKQLLNAAKLSRAFTFVHTSPQKWTSFRTAMAASNVIELHKNMHACKTTDCAPFYSLNIWKVTRHIVGKKGL